MRQRYLARRSRLILSAFESLEKRSMLCAVHDDSALAEDLRPFVRPDDGHVLASQLLSVRPDLAGKDLWSPETFNPTNSSDQADWLYDPHFIEDDINKGTTHYAEPVTGRAVNNALPDLVPLTGGGYLSPFIDTTEVPGHNLMRFSTAVGNMGAGPATLVSANSGTPPASSGLTSWINADGTQNVVQQIYSFNTETNSYSLSGYRSAGRMVWHSGHGHFHLEGYANYRLLTKNPDGTAGPVAKRSNFDGTDAVGDKIGFCLINILSSFTLPGTSTSSTTLPGFNRPGQPSTSCGFLQGISTGKADVYDSIYDGQWVDVTGVPNGNYFLEVTLDALNVIQETNETNNTVLVPVTLNTGNATGGSILPDRFEPNNTPETASDLGVLGVQTQPGLTAHISNESDYFKFEAASTGAGTVQLVISNRDVNLYLYDSAMNLLKSSTTSAYGTTTSPSTETVSYNFVAGQTYFVRAHGFGTDTDSTGISTNFSLKVNINPTINAQATQAIALESSLTSGMFSIARNGPTSSPLPVAFSVAGTATRGVDYDLFQDGVPITGNTLSIGNEASAIELEVRPISDAFVEANETVILTLGSGAYFVGTGGTASLTINDTPPTSLGTAFAYETGHTLTFDFSLDVGASLAAEDLILNNVTTGQTIAATSVLYDALTNRATFGFSSILPNGDYNASLLAASVTHAQGVSLVADATLSFFVLAGDMNRDRAVNFDDLLILAQAYGSTSKTFSQGNVNYDAAGNVDFDDLLALAQAYGSSLLSVVPAKAAVPAAKSKLRRGSDVLV